MKNKRNFKKKYEPLLNGRLLHPNHKKPLTRRDFLSQGFMAGAGTYIGASSLLSSPFAHALSPDLEAFRNGCGLNINATSAIPFICIDLAGGANISGSNVLVGNRGGQLDFLSNAGYSKLGLPAEFVPNAGGVDDFVNTQLGLAFHSDSAFLRGILEKTNAATQGNVNGAVIPARSDNDTGNNPHNPMYGIYRAGANGQLSPLIGSIASESGGNSVFPEAHFDATVRPAKVDRPSDVTGFVDLGKLTQLLNEGSQSQAEADTLRVMESIFRLSNMRLNKTQLDPKLSASAGFTNADIKQLVRCGYLKSADLTEQFGSPVSLDLFLDAKIVGGTDSDGTFNPIFTSAEINDDREFAKTAAIMKMVIEGHAGAGTITMGGFDYHTGDRSTGELRDLRAGRCMGACLEYAARQGKPLMLYVFSDGSVASNGMIDSSVEGRGKAQWTGDNSSTAASFFLVYNPGSRPTLVGNNADEQARHQQLGYMRSDASVETSATPAANSVNQLVDTVILNYMALQGNVGAYATTFPGHGLGNNTMLQNLIAFESIV